MCVLREYCAPFLSSFSAVECLPAARRPGTARVKRPARSTELHQRRVGRNVSSKYCITGIFRGCKLSRIAESQIFMIKLSQIVGNDDDTPIDNDAAVLNEIFTVKTFANFPETAKFAKVFTRERIPLYGSLFLVDNIVCCAVQVIALDGHMTYMYM